MNNYRRNLKERSGAGSGSQPPRNSRGWRARAAGGAAAISSRSKVGNPQKVIEKNEHKKSISSFPCCSGSASLRGNDKFITTNSQIGTEHHNICSAPPQEAGCSTSTNHTSMNSTKTATMAAEKSANGVGGGDFVKECPRVIVPLTRKEKEEDFLVMKGTKLPYRPKKRPNTVNRVLQYCFPGMWLSDVTRARYEVKEKKRTTKMPKRRGLQGMESVDSYSE